MKKFDDLINRNYEAVIKRGQVNDDTLDYEFIEKMKSELDEIIEAYNSGSKEEVKNETVDLASVCITFLTHRGYNFPEEFRINVTEKNERRAIDET